MKLSEKLAGKSITVEIPELRLKEQLLTDANGKAIATFKAKKLIRWSPKNPKLYQVRVSSGEDSVEEQIGFRNIQVKGTQIMLNGEPFFYKGISFHEEIASRKGRAYSLEDALLLLTEAKELGVNVIRLAPPDLTQFSTALKKSPFGKALILPMNKHLRKQKTCMLKW